MKIYNTSGFDGMHDIQLSAEDTLDQRFALEFRDVGLRHTSAGQGGVYLVSVIDENGKALDVVGGAHCTGDNLTGLIEELTEKGWKRGVI